MFLVNHIINHIINKINKKENKEIHREDIIDMVNFYYLLYNHLKDNKLYFVLKEWSD